jgi:hypothetical protein
MSVVIDGTDGVTAPGLSLDGSPNWRVTVSGTNLIFTYNGVAKLKVDSSGNVVAVGNVTAFGTI